MPKKKLIIVLGPTASGKSELAVKLAKKFNGEIISADSRQVYQGMDIGTGKVPRDKNWKLEIGNPAPETSFRYGAGWKLYYHKGIPHHLLDAVSPKRRFTVVQYRKLALKAIDKILKNNKIPILCGGTGFYIRAVMEGLAIPEVPPNWKLRKGLEKKSAEELYQMLKKLDPRRAKTIEKENPRRLIRAIEIIRETKKPVPPLSFQPLPYPTLMIGIKKGKQELKKLIRKRLLKRLKMGMIAEVKKLKKSGLSWKRLEEFGLEYRWIARYLQKKINFKEMSQGLQKDTEHFAKKQMTWWKSDPEGEPTAPYGASKRICWVKTYKQAEGLAKKFLKN